MKIIFLLAAMFFLNAVSYSQWNSNEDPLTIKELKLTRLQQKKIRKINSDAGNQIKQVQQSKVTTEERLTSINKIKGARIKKIRNFLTRDQQLAWRKIIKENKPRRGVTGLPNEKANQ